MQLSIQHGSSCDLWQGSRFADAQGSQLRFWARPSQAESAQTELFHVLFQELLVIHHVGETVTLPHPGPTSSALGFRILGSGLALEGFRIGAQRCGLALGLIRFWAHV